jgi:hypothetical protein
MTTINHPVFGKLEFLPAGEIDEFGDILKLPSVSFEGASYDSTLYYSKKSLANPGPALDQCAKLIDRLPELDKAARANVPADLVQMWIADRLDPETWPSEETAAEAQKLLRDAFPGIEDMMSITPAQFGRALKVNAFGFSIAPEGSGDSALTIDYIILPMEIDNYIIAAKFAPDGKLIEVDMES